jgi:hypothetical protein
MDMTNDVELPHWPRATVAILVTGGNRPHAIPVSAVVRAGPTRMLLGLARSRGSLTRLRVHPEVTVSVTSAQLAFSADGRARIAAETLVDGVAAVAVDVDVVHDHLRPTFTIEDGVRWHWADAEAERRDGDVQAALRHLAAAETASAGPSHGHQS